MSQLPIRIIFGKEIIRLAEEYGYYAVCADTKCCSFEDFGDIYPERQISIGIAEQNLIGVASGLASCGHKVVLATYSVFATMRACEQLRTYICHPKQDVIVMGTHAGLQTGSEGVSHTAIEDIAILRALPNMTIIQPSDAVSARVLARKALEFHGPLYVRLPFDAVEDINDEATYHVEIGKANWVKRRGKDVTLIATGIMLDRSVIGGLGGAVAEVLATNLPVSMRMIGIQDCFARSGDAEALYEANHMTAADIVAAAEELVERKKIR